MSKKFEIGEQVSILNLPLTGIVLEIGEKIKVALSDGFDEYFFPNELVKNTLKIQDITIEHNIEQPKSKIIKGSIEEIDIHATFNVKSLRNLSSYEIVERQLHYFKEEIENCKKNHIETLRVIHGKGTGTLRALLLVECKKIPKIKTAIPSTQFYRDSALEIIFLD